MWLPFSLACSMAVALTLVPMLASRAGRRKGEAGNGTPQGGVIFNATGKMLSGLEEQYKQFLHFSLNNRLILLILAFGLLGGSLYLIPLVGVEMMPETDQGEVQVQGEMALGYQAGGGGPGLPPDRGDRPGGKSPKP